MRRPGTKGQCVQDEGITVGVGQARRCAPGLAHIQIYGTTIVPVTDQVGRRQPPILLCDLFPQLSAEPDDGRLMAGRDAKRSQPAERRHLRQLAYLSVSKIAWP